MKNGYDQDSLRVRQQLDAKAKNHNQQVRDPGLEEGELVYLRSHQVRGTNKIQDLWHPCPVRRLHWTELRSALRREELDVQPVSPVYKVDDSVPIAAMSDSEESMMVVFEDNETTRGADACK